MSDTLEYSYRPKAWKILLFLVITTAAAVGMGFIAADNEVGLRFFRLITLPPAGATAFYWGIAAICGASAVTFIYMLASGVTRRTYHIRLTPAEFSAPVSLFRKENLTVPISEIERVSIQIVNKVHFLQIRTAKGKVAINRTDIGKAAFEELSAALAQRIAAVGQA